MAATPYEAPSVLIYGHKKLRGITNLVPTDYPTILLQDHIVQARATLSASTGTAIAANQVNLNLRFFLVKQGNGEGYPIFPQSIVVDELGYGVFINPYLTDLTGSMCHTEGCLSLPNYTQPTDLPVLEVQRYLSLTLHYQQLVQDPNGPAGALILSQFYSVPSDGSNSDLKFFNRIVQHEIDHLDGKFYIDQFAPADLDSAQLTGFKNGSYPPNASPRTLTLPSNKY